MPTVVITKISGLISVTDNNVTGSNPLNYRNASGSYQFSTNNATVYISITDKVSPPFEKNVAWGDLRINGSTPSSADNAKSLLLTLFGT